MCFSNDGINYTDWATYDTSKAWVLTVGDGTRTVYVKYKNGVGLVSSPYSDSIILDTTEPESFELIEPADDSVISVVTIENLVRRIFSRNLQENL